MAVKITKKKVGEATTTVEHKDGKKSVAESTTSEQVPVKTTQEGHTVEAKDAASADNVPQHPCIVGVDLHYTHNLGNYQSARVGVMIQIPCGYTEIDQVYEFAETWADSKLKKQVAALTGEAE